MVAALSVMAQIIREGMNDYWRVVYSKTDEGLNATELSWKQEWRRDMERIDRKFGAALDAEFGKGAR